MMKRLIILGIVGVLLSDIFIQYAASSEEVQIANPASVYCVQSGYTLEIRANANGSEYGVCIFPNGSECEEWAFFRNECGAGYRSIPDTNSKGKNKQEKD